MMIVHCRPLWFAKIGSYRQLQMNGKYWLQERPSSELNIGIVSISVPISREMAWYVAEC